MGKEGIPIGEGGALEAFEHGRLEEEITGFVDKIENKLNGRGPIVKSLPLRPEWQKAWDEVQSLREQHDLLDRKHNVAKEFFWALVHKETDDFRDMRYNKKTKEIEIFANPEDTHG